MKLSRRQIIASGAGAGAYLSLGAANALAPGQTGLLTKPIPSTGEPLPVIGIGTHVWSPISGGQAGDSVAATLRAFRALGGRVVETAPAYRNAATTPRQLLDSAGLADAFFVATKVHRERAAEGRQRLAGTLNAMRRPQLDLLQLPRLRASGAELAELLEWRATGRIRYLGVTASRTSQHAEVEALMRQVPLDFIQVNYSLQERAAEARLLPLARERGIAVLASRPLANGRLLRSLQATALPEWAAEFDCASWAQFFLKYAISQPAVTCALPGMTSPAHARDNMAAGYGRLPDASLRERQRQLIERV
ncbi:MAG: aldo/keto reductase [Gammaproteobacteria bacterium]|jgi:diketogulonate reductase-like aldo/keto reductase|nr:aldo/keto reductase [Gammaproteobacteria bacterium]